MMNRFRPVQALCCLAFLVLALLPPSGARASGYDFDTGNEIWTVRGLSRFVCPTPVIGDDGTLFMAEEKQLRSARDSPAP